MRLLNTKTLQLEQFLGSNIPPYAVLSHTWEEEEVTLQDVLNGNARDMKGWAKINETCRLSLVEHGLGYAWVDTCCIDKTSSAELSEAINSMFRWYLKAQICYVYLSDLGSLTIDDDSLAKCKWFTRGWTLQELIASRHAHFYDRWWNLRGSKNTLLGRLSRITRIAEEVLRDCECLPELSVAEKMSWAARRTTTLPEDMAYCLLGIFDISMPMLYGEGTKAFERLQEEIIRKTNDLSIFSWEHQDYTQRQGVLAQSPRDFDTFSAADRPALSARAPEFVMTNKGIRITTTLWEVFQNKTEPRGHRRSRDLVMPLSGSSQNNRRLLLLAKFGPGRYARLGTASLTSEREVTVLKSDIVETIFLSAFSSPHLTKVIRDSRKSSVRVLCNGVGIVDVSPRSHWDPRHNLFFLDPEETIFLLQCQFEGDFTLTGSFVVIVLINYGHEENTVAGLNIVEPKQRIETSWSPIYPGDQQTVARLFEGGVNGKDREIATASLVRPAVLGADYKRPWRGGDVSMDANVKRWESNGKPSLTVEISASLSGDVRKVKESVFDLVDLSD